MRPSARCAFAATPFGALSFRQDITAAPMLMKEPLECFHLEPFSEGYIDNNDLSSISEKSNPFMQILQLEPQIIFPNRSFIRV